MVVEIVTNETGQIDEEIVVVVVGEVMRPGGGEVILHGEEGVGEEDTIVTGHLMAVVRMIFMDGGEVDQEKDIEKCNNSKWVEVIIILFLLWMTTGNGDREGDIATRYVLSMRPIDGVKKVLPRDCHLTLNSIPNFNRVT